LNLDLKTWALAYGVTPQALAALKSILTPPMPKGDGRNPKALEGQVQKEIRLAANETDGLLLRNNSGVAIETRKDGTRRAIRYGLGNTEKKLNETFKSSDLIGITPIMVRPDMLGRTIGVFTAIETKRRNWKYAGNPRERAQLHFIKVIRARGGIAGIVTCKKDYLKLIGESYGKV
jgi:hypothetical protein